MKTRILSYLLVFSMILALLPASALAEGESTTTPYITATVKHALDSGGAETGQITAQIEAYLTDKDNQSRTVKPCDIIFLIEQSAFMNTQNDTTQYGQERADILNSMESLLQNLPAPTTGAHRVAIAGFGRINNSGSSDSYIESQHPGARLTTDQNPSLNTGYYTHGTDGSPVFHSQSGWTEWSSLPGNNNTTLPEMPDGYLDDESGRYDNVFMSIDAAKDVIDVDKMVSWHAGASRMDAGLQITEQLAKIAQAHKATDEDRNLIIFVAASSLPYQNSAGFQILRSEAAQAAAQKLKDDYGATIFGFGDFRPLTLQSGMSSEEQRTKFNETMAGICGNSNTQDGTPYFKGLSQVHDIGAALNELLIQIDANVNPNTKSLDIDVKDFQEKSTAHTSHTWKELKGKHHILTSSAINETASVDYYRFKEYDANGNPQFDATPFLRIERSLSDIGSGDSIQTALSLQPIPPVGTEGTAYGVKAVITITDPVCVDYKWAGRWTPDFNPPDHEHAARGVKHSPTNPEQNETTSDTMKLKFDGWYRLWDDSIDHEGNGKKTWTYDGKKYVAYQDTVYDAFGSDFTLYGRWIPSIDVNFQWIGSVIPEGTELPSTVSLPLSDSGTASFTPAVPSQEGYEFDGWYKDSACTERYGENGENLTENTTLYGRWTRIGTKAVTFTVVNGSWNTESDWYNNITQTNDTETLTIEVPLRNGKGTLTPDLVPHVDNQDMIPAEGYKAPGTWGDNAPDTNTDAITEDGTYAYTYTFPEANTYTITYRWVTGTEVPEDAKLPAQQKQKESGAGKNPTFKIATAPSSNDEKWHFDGWYTTDTPIQTDTPVSGKYDFTDNDTKNLTLYGKWTHEPCTVTFYADYFQPAQGHFNTDDYSISYTVPYGSTLTKEQDTVPTPVTELAHTCYFEGWRDDYKTSLLDTEEEQEDTEEEQEDTEGEQENTQDKPAAYSEDSTAGTFYTSKAIQDMTIKSDLNFVAQWWPIVTFNANGGDWELMEDRPTERYVPVPANKNHIDALRPPRKGRLHLPWMV